MREMKDSHVVWMGKIPACWKVIPVKYVVNIENGSDPKKEGLTPVYGSGNASFKTCGEHKEGPAVLLGRKGTLNIPQYVEGKYWNVDTAFDAKPVDDYNLKLFYYSAICFDYDNYSTQTALPSMTQSTYNNFRVPLPSSDEQNRIVNYLDSKCSEIDAISADIQKEIETLEQYKRSVITEAVTKGLNPEAEMKDSGIEWVGNVPAHWDVLANKYVMKKRKDICTKWNGENVLSLTMNGVIVRDLDNPVGKMPTTFDGYQFVYSGNLLMCLFDYDVTPRCVGIVKNAGVTSPAYSRFELKENATLEYFYYYYLMIDFTKELLHLAKNLRHSFTEEQLGALKVPLPPLDEQKNIATYLDSKCKEIESVIASKKQQLTVIDSYKKSLIYEYVTGKKEVV